MATPINFTYVIFQFNPPFRQVKIDVRIEFNASQNIFALYSNVKQKTARVIQIMKGIIIV